MRFFSLICENESTEQATEELIARTRAAVDGDIDVIFAFCTAYHAQDASAIAQKICRELDPEVLIGCCAEGIIGQQREVERAPGISLLVGQLPGVVLHPFHIPMDDWQALLADEQELAQRMGCGPQSAAVIGFGDPFSTPITQLMDQMDRSLPGVPLIGGMASAARSPGENFLLKDDLTFTDGLVGVTLSGNVRVQTLVSQGCRPIGRAMVVTKSHDNIILQLGGKPALAALSEMVAALPPDQQQLIGDRGLMIGRAISEYKDQFERGDFLIRALSGADKQTGAIAVADIVRTGQTIQFHVHDAQSAHEDLEMLLHKAVAAGSSPPAGGLLFDCNGRGTRLFDAPHHDIAAATKAMPKTPIAGFFAAGEVGPVGGKNFIHGHTASFALLRPGD